ncbi:Vps55p Ecym_3579 [Eremothecium cymbalariae DBVPG|uniref:Vacuolar protein sorting-associated protein 55 n=1 Tax=Eremothecium cymbalariae (strain CBS 270.75 / DBVPG 7215 / KCTC 17166 / NRRL Y-17582) TaxID=931890 RepID=G8JQR5_ERECY|nr:Hypothetical protein Ecym_3579 [Eremothecium cymbalariae DBVPG\
MGITVSPLTKVICLSGLLATGFLLVILSCSLYHNYYPLIDFQVFILAPIPNAISSRSNYDGHDFMNDRVKSAQDLRQFFTGLLVASGIIMPLVFQHAQIINKVSCVMSILGGLIVYSSMVIFGWFFTGSWEDDEDALFSY